MSVYSPMVVRAARVLCKRNSDVCGVDNDDNWKTYGEAWLADAQAALYAAGAHEVLEALKALLAFSPGTQNAFTKQARAAIAKATGSTE